MFQITQDTSLVINHELFQLIFTTYLRSIHVAGGPATGTACSDSNTWLLDTTWLQRSVEHRYGVNVIRTVTFREYNTLV